MKVINLYGGPGSGKSTLAWLLSGELKKRGYNIEYVQEFAKQCVYEDRKDILERDQLYILAKQNNSLLKLRKHNLDFVVVDSPLLLSAVYNTSDIKSELIESLVLNLYNTYDNVNIFLQRNLKFGYNPNGRIQKKSEDAEEIDKKIKSFLTKTSIQHIEIKNSESATNEILKILGVRNETYPSPL